MKAILATLLLTLPTLAFAVDLDGYYITPKVGVSKTFNTGKMGSVNSAGTSVVYKNEDLGTGSAFGFSVGKYLTDNFRLELEATKRTGYEFDTRTTNAVVGGLGYSDKADIETHALFINGFYDFQPFFITNTAITPYLGGGVGLSRNKMAKNVSLTNGLTNGFTIDGNTINQFAYKFSAGTLVSLTEQLSLDVNYQYVNLGAFKGGTTLYLHGVRRAVWDLKRGINGGEIESQEIMFGLQYKFN